MKSTLLIAILAALAVNHYSQAASLRVRRQLVPAEFRNINIDSYLKNPRSVLFQLKCIVYDGPCDRIGKYLKVTIPELITGTCQHCSPSDRQTAGRLVAHIQKNYPKEWHDAIRKYQGGQVVKPEDANKFESLLGVKLESDLVASSTAAPAPATTAAAAVVVVPSSAAPAAVAVPVPVAVATPVSSSVAPAVVAQPAVEAAKPAEVAQPAVIAPSEESKPVVVETIVPTENTMSVVV